MTIERAIARHDRTRRASEASKSSNRHPHTFCPVPPPSRARLDASLTDTPFDLDLARTSLRASSEKGKTVLYLAYGSNLCRETFRGVRGIRPLSQINVVVPELRLTFDLPGLPYQEPCFANSALRVPDASSQSQNGKDQDVRRDDRENSNDYHKDRWHKGMVGCVYEVTLSDYAHIIATEGGGASYQDILVTCYALPPESQSVPEQPMPPPFKAHTLFAPASDNSKTGVGYARPDPSYAQPSARYLKLITDGADELALPQEYKEYLHDIRPYRITTKRQWMGKITFMALWMPFVMLILNLNKKLSDENGKSPKWLATLSGWIFKGMWFSYDVVWKPVYGDGERTVGEGEDEEYARKGYTEGGSGFLREEDEEELVDTAWGASRLKESGVEEKERLLV